MGITDQSRRLGSGRLLAIALLPVLFGWALMITMHVGEGTSGMAMGPQAGAATMAVMPVTSVTEQDLPSAELVGARPVITPVAVSCAAPATPGLAPALGGPAATPAEAADCAGPASRGTLGSRAPGALSDPAPPALEVLSISRT